MVRLKWDNEDSPMYQTGVSKGVFYGDDGVGHAWSGLISVTEKPQTNAPTAIYNAMGSKYDTFGNVAEKKHGLSCYTYPEVMDNYLGYEYLEDFGFTVDERPPKKFHMAYRVELGNGLYEIHVLLNQIATFGETARQTKSNNAAPSTITMNLEGAVDPRLGTSHIRLDSRLPITKSAEILLFGDQYTDANIDSFLTAEPVWETVGANYAPIIEPDYDNMVWVGGENWFPSEYLSNRDNFNPGSYVTTKQTFQLKPDTVYQFYVDGIEQYDPDEWHVLVVADGTNGIIGWNAEGYTILSTLLNRKHEHGSSGPYSKSFKTPPSGLIYFLDFVSGKRINDNPEGWWITDKLIYPRINEGTSVHPWTPYPGDSKILSPDEPRPENYKPGIKKSDAWTGTDKLTVFYDETTNGMGVYSKTLLSDLDTYQDLYVDDYMPYVDIPVLPKQQLSGSRLTISATVDMVNPIYPLISNKYASLGLGILGPTTDNPPNTRGSKEIHTSTTNFKTSGDGYDSILVYHGGLVDSGIVSFSRMSVRTSDDADYFDINTVPQSRGDRYQRVETPGGDYTIHQQLRLRSTSKVKLSDITQYDFWLEAADSMLLSQNETFTFNGPQAVIDGDTFTIDDSIQGYAEG